MTEAVEVMRAYRCTLDPTPDQLGMLEQHAGTARWAYNHAIAAKREAHERWRAAVEDLVAAGTPEDVACKSVKVPVPTKPAIQKALNLVKGDDRRGLDGACPWWHTVSTYAFQSAFADADTAWSNWLSSLSGKRAGRRVGYPRFKKKGRSRDSFRLYGNLAATGTRRLRLPRLGEVRTHDNLRRLRRIVARRGGVIQNVTVSRAGHRWYASVLVKQMMLLPGPTRRQRAAGAVGVDLGVSALATLSTGEHVANPRVLQRASRRLARAQRDLSRTQRGSARRRRAACRMARLHTLVAERRATECHRLTKRLATGWEVVALEDLSVGGMTSSAAGTADAPGRNVRAKAGLNRSILDAAFGAIRAQIAYKTRWYGSRLVLADRWYPSSKTCSACGHARAKLPLSERVYRCDSCGLALDRDVNAAINIMRHASRQVASERGDTLNARGATVRPDRLGGRASRGESGRPPLAAVATPAQ